LLLVAIVVVVVNCQPGPGMGPWIVMSPESQGLNTSELEAAELRVLERIPRRVCYLVAKNGYLVYEKYYNGWSEQRIKQGYSTTKSHCSSLYGIATQQGWANASQLVRTRNSGTRECNPDATFNHVLTMTGESTNINNPQFLYDTDGTRCLDNLQDFIHQNNPEGLTTEQFKDRYWQQAIGMEHMEWTSNPMGELMCGFTSVVSCRDMLRAGQLWLNEGAWAGQQIINRNHILTGRTFVYPNSNPPIGTEYGYTVWQLEGDDVDHVHSFMGALSQCAHISKPHEVVVVSMGAGDVVGARCIFAWTESRDAIVSNDLLKGRGVREIKEPQGVIDHEGVLQLKQFFEEHPEAVMKEEIQAMNEYLIEHNEAPLKY